MVGRLAATGLTLTALLILSAAASPAVLGFGFKAGALKGTQLTTQKWKMRDPEVKAIECKKETLEGTVPPPPQSTVTLKAKYGECVAVASPATVSAAEYEFSEEGWLSLLNRVTIEVPALKCHLVLEPAKRLKTVSYFAGPHSEVEVKAALTGVAYSSSGGLCGTAGSYTNGEYEGDSLLE